MKHRISVTLSESILVKAKEHLRKSSAVRNQSHLVELALEEFLENE